MNRAPRENPTAAVEVKHNWIKEQLKALEGDVTSSITKEQVISILNSFSEAQFNKNKSAPENSAQAILAIQAGLYMLGQFNGKIDGLFEERETKPAILAFQKKWNAAHPNDTITVDGFPGPQTIGKLLIELEAEQGEKREAPKKTLDEARREEQKAEVREKYDKEPLLSKKEIKIYNDFAKFCAKNNLMCRFDNDSASIRVSDTLVSKIPLQNLIREEKNGVWKLGEQLYYGNLADALNDLKAIMNVLRFASQREPREGTDSSFSIKEGTFEDEAYLNFNSEDRVADFVATRPLTEWTRDIGETIGIERTVRDVMDGVPAYIKGDKMIIKNYTEEQYRKMNP